jgi:hypothetical protein
VIKLAVGKIIGFAIANFIWQLVTGKHDWEFAATVSFFQAWAIAFAVRDTYKLLKADPPETNK